MKIVLTGGGTAGHVTPNLALIPYLKNYFDKIVYVGSENGIEKRLCAEYGIEYYSTPVVKLRRDALLSCVNVPFKLAGCVKEAKKLLKDISPDIVFSKGGYVALPTCIAASKLRIPVVAHESDITLGLANKITSLFAKCVVTSYSGTKAKNSVFIGNPLRDELFEADGTGVARKYGLPCKKPLLLVVGGSGGSHALNEIIYASLDDLLEKYEIIHITGKDADDVKKKGYFSKPYANDIFDLYAAADVIISRAGANAVREISALGKRVIYIPLPKSASRGDQILNAKEAAAGGRGLVLEQESLTRTKLLTSLDFLLSSPAPGPVKDISVNEKIAKLLINTAETYSAKSRLNQKN